MVAQGSGYANCTGTFTTAEILRGEL